MTATTTPAAAGVQPPDAGIPGLAGFVRFLETNVAPEGLFAADLFGDVAFPHWWLQATSAAELVAIRQQSHPWPGRVRIERAGRTPTGFVVWLQERWQADDQDWFAREAFWADVQDGVIIGLRVMCTGDWDEQLQRRHAQAVTLTRP